MSPPYSIVDKILPFFSMTTSKASSKAPDQLSTNEYTPIAHHFRPPSMPISVKEFRAFPHNASKVS